MLPLPFVGLVYAIVFWSAYTIWIILEMTGSVRKRLRDQSTSRDQGSYTVIIAVLWISIALDFALSGIVRGAAIQWERIPLFYIGVALMLAGLAFRFYAMGVLGRFFTYRVGVQTDHVVVQSGPYRYIRHPSYTGALITLAGLGLALGNWLGLLALLGCMSIAYGYRIKVEEAALATALGEPYKQYMLRTRRLVPFLF
ncbi:MAG: methyltransferase family protein [Candidatus Acidiferrales bacterium]